MHPLSSSRSRSGPVWTKGCQYRTGREKPTFRIVNVDECEHAVDAFQGSHTPLDAGDQQGLRVGMVGTELVPQTLQLGPQFFIVVQLSVEHQPVATIGCGHGLIGIGRQIKDG